MLLGTLGLVLGASGVASAAITLNGLDLGPDSPISAGQYRWVLQSADGNFVQYGPNGAVRASFVVNEGVDRVAFQRTDCNVVGYAGATPKWASLRTSPGANGGCKFTFTNDGRLVVTDPNGVQLWDFAEGVQRV